MNDYAYPALGEEISQCLEVLAMALCHKGETMAVAESCTGGLLAGFITGLAGQSLGQADPGHRQVPGPDRPEHG